MPKHGLKLLVLLTAVSVAPASAGEWNSRSAAYQDGSGCPYHRARLETGWAAREKGETTVTLTDRVPPDSSLFIGSGSRLLP